MVRYHICLVNLSVENFAGANRSHWHKENKFHWRVDVAMNEDDCKIRSGKAAELFSYIKHIAINIFPYHKE